MSLDTPHATAAGGFDGIRAHALRRSPRGGADRHWQVGSTRAATAEKTNCCRGRARRFLRSRASFVRKLLEGSKKPTSCTQSAEVIQVRVKDDAVEAQQGPIEHPDATIHTTDMKSYLALLTHQMSPEEALSKGLVRIEGDAGALGRFLDLFGLPRNPVEVDVHS